MSPRIGIAASIASGIGKATSNLITVTDTPGVLAGMSAAANQSGTMIAQMVVQNTTTGGELLKASLENGRIVDGSELMNGTGTLTVTRDPGGDNEATSTATCYIYYSTEVSASNTAYFIAPTENSDGLTYGNDTEFDLATDFAADISPVGGFNFYSATLQIGAFNFNLTIGGVLRKCTASNTVATENNFLVAG